MIRVFEESGEVSGVLRFPVGGQYFPSGPPGSLAPDGQRNTTLGTNMSVSIFVIPQSVYLKIILINLIESRLILQWLVHVCV